MSKFLLQFLRGPGNLYLGGKLYRKLYRGIFMPSFLNAAHKSISGKVLYQEMLYMGIPNSPGALRAPGGLYFRVIFHHNQCRDTLPRPILFRIQDPIPPVMYQRKSTWGDILYGDFPFYNFLDVHPKNVLYQTGDLFCFDKKPVATEEWMCSDQVSGHRHRNHVPHCRRSNL